MSNLLVTGANGKLGRHVTQLLLEAGRDHIIAASRDTAKIADLAAKGAETRTADFDDPASLAAAFKGVDRVLIISTDSLGTGQRLRQHLNAVKAAAEAGAEIVYTSMPKPEGSAVTFAPDHAGTEQAIIATGRPYTILRDAWYQENLLMTLPGAFASGTLYTSAGDGKISHVSHADVARSAAAALSRSSANQILTLTGPELLTTKQIAALASEVIGKPLAVVDLTDAQLAGGMKAAGVPEAIIPMLVSFDTTTREGGFDILTDDVETLTGRKPEPLRAFLEASKSAF
ncbi:SDR family oxidoreductase [Asticcacaulis taihuensis]|jgi:NAD(P)H dehydrogenase (quinone)|uniref:NAD(P)H dehydrogenase (Quinone) n=1 Tax=Asticcacaulis taihuensis TaxID=260084 RepID=A0A1G4SC33_9CAUL|nr:SDR family oxidoreductase [Asticcacaulis taihuensis]SCW66591.1 NAD(P)H dehydrogenase (quinone) [Asticcacaulis taihuensis]